MEKYKILEHPAELRLRIYGKTIEELFVNAAEAMADILKSKEIQPPQVNNQCLEVESLKVESIDVNSLLVDFLSEILAKSQINKKVYKVKSLRLKVSEKGAALESEIAGILVERFDEDIKAVTYEDLNIHQQPIWQTDLVLDI